MDFLNFAEFIWYTFILGFCRHLPILAAYLMMVLFISGRIGRSLGAPQLIWDERSWRRYFSGFALTLFFVKLFVAGFILMQGLRAEAIRNANDPVQEPKSGFLMVFTAKWVEPSIPLVPGLPSASPAHAVLIYKYFFYMSSILVCVMGIVRVFGPFKVSHYRTRFRWRWPAFTLGVGSAIALVLVLTQVIFTLGEFTFAQELSQWVDELSVSFQKKEIRETHEEWVHVSNLFVVALLVFGYCLERLDRRARTITPVVTVCTVVALGCSAYGFFYFWIWSSPVFGDIPLSLILVLLAVGMLWLGGWSRYKFQFRHIDGAPYTNPKPLPQGTPPPAATPPAASLPQPADMPRNLTALHSVLPPAPRPYRQEHNAEEFQKTRNPLVVLCVSGGASRAAVWVALVLRELNKHIPGFSHNIRIITGASGGMVGAAYHVSALQKPKDWPHPQGACSFATNDKTISLEQMVQNLASDAVSPIIHQFLFYDVWALASPQPLGYDRGIGLEDGWRNQLDGALDVPLMSLAQGEKEGWRPILVFSPMMVEDGRRLLISNEPLDYLTNTIWPSLDYADRLSYSTPAVEFGKQFPIAEEFRVSTAARMNASFPYISPAAILPTLPRRRLVDAGYYDDYGIDLAASWLFHHARVLEKQYSKVIVIQMRDTKSEEARQQPRQPGGEGNPVTRGLEGLTSPPEGAVTALFSVMAYRNDRQLQILGDLLTGITNNPNFFTTVLFENSADVSMSWYVAPEELREMEKCATDCKGHVQDRIRRLTAWL